MHLSRSGGLEAWVQFPHNTDNSRACECHLLLCRQQHGLRKLKITSSPGIVSSCKRAQIALKNLLYKDARNTIRNGWRTAAQAAELNLDYLGTHRKIE